jgi:hypothetical protein
VATDNQARALRDGDRVAPTLLLDDRGEELDLVGAVPVRVDRVGLERVRIDEGGVGGFLQPRGRLPAARAYRPCRRSISLVQP